MTIITIQPSSSYSPLDKGGNINKKSRLRRRRSSAASGNGVGGYTYPLCLSLRFLCLASLITCWVGFLLSFGSDSFGIHDIAGAQFGNFVDDGSGCEHDDQHSVAVQAAAVGALGDGTLLDTAHNRKNRARPHDDQNTYNERATSHPQRATTAYAASAATATTNQPRQQENDGPSTADADTTTYNDNSINDETSRDDDDEEDDEEEDIDLDTMLFVENRILIAPGELPGYTGWARPENTLAGQFQITGVSEMKGKTGQEWFVDVECMAEECKQGGSLFYVRAYGPSIITGKVSDNGDGTYRAIFYPTDPGRYTVEVVLEFSEKPLFDTFPVGVNDTELAYEGWLLPGFPMQITFEEAERDDSDNGNDTKAVATTDDRTWCNFDDLLETDTDSGRTKGRWKVVDNVRTKYHRQITPDGNGVSYLGYQHGLNSLGVKLKYENNDCRVLTYARANRDAEGAHLVDRCLSGLGIANSPEPEHQIHVVFVGCSVMRLMRSSFDFLLRKANMTNVKTSLVDIRRGLFRTMPHMKRQLNNFTETNPDEKRFVVFNTGLHDIDRLCSGRMWAARQRDEEIMNKTIPEGQPCIETYRQQFEEMVQFIGEYPAELKVFRSTTPGWMKVGTHVFAAVPPLMFARLAALSFAYFIYYILKAFLFAFLFLRHLLISMATLDLVGRLISCNHFNDRITW